MQRREALLTNYATNEDAATTSRELFNDDERTYDVPSKWKIGNFGTW